MLMRLIILSLDRSHREHSKPLIGSFIIPTTSWDSVGVGVLLLVPVVVGVLLLLLLLLLGDSDNESIVVGEVVL